jgi:hypothetical protein
VDKPERMYDHCSPIRRHEVFVDRQGIATTDVTAGLRSLIGRRVRYMGELYEVFEILEHDPLALVLQNEAHLRIQPDQHGEAHRRVPETVTVPVTLNAMAEPDFREMHIELLEESRRP